jgi:lipoyl(octanoyl) transferase
MTVADAAAFQRRLVYDVGGDPDTAAVLFCDHPPGVLIGRHGSRAEVRLTDEELAARRWPVQYAAVGGGTMLLTAGQVACYPVFPLARLGLTPAGYVTAVCQLVADVLSGFGAAVTADDATIQVNGRRVAHVGLAVRNGVTAGGLVVNVCPDLALFRAVRAAGEPRPMTSLQRECRSRVRPQAVRARLLQGLADRLGAGRVSVLSAHESHANAATG